MSKMYRNLFSPRRVKNREMDGVIGYDRIRKQTTHEMRQVHCAASRKIIAPGGSCESVNVCSRYANH